MTAIGELAGLSRGALLARLRDAEVRAERATGFAMAAIGDVSDRVNVVARESDKARIFATIWKQKARQERSGKRLVARMLDSFVREVSREVGEETGNVTDAIEMVDALVAEHQGARLALSTLLTAEKHRAEESARADHAMYMASGWRRLAVEMLRHANREADAARDENAEATFWCNKAVEQRSRADRAEMRLACWRLAEAFRTLGEGIAEQVCAACGWPRRIHKPDARWKRVTVDDTTYDKCAAFVAATETL